jgi:hypothetical protein
MNKVKGNYLEEVEVLEQEEEVEAVMKESQVMKALHKDVLFARRVIMLRKAASLRESHNVFIAKSLTTCKKVVDY